MANLIDKIVDTLVSAALGTTPVAEQVLAHDLPYLEDQYGPLSPVSNTDGTIDVYDESGELVAMVTEDGELIIICEPVCEESCEDEFSDECNPVAESCTPDEGKAVKNTAKKFAPEHDDYVEFADEIEIEPEIFEEEIEHAPEPLSDPTPFVEEVKAEEVEAPEVKELAPPEVPEDGPAFQESAPATPAQPVEQVPPEYILTGGAGDSPKFDSAMKLQAVDVASVLDEARGGFAAKGLALSTQHAVDSKVEMREGTERDSAPFMDGAVRAIADRIKGFFTGGSESKGEGSRELAAAESCDVSNLPLQHVDAKGFAGMRRQSAARRRVARRGDSIFSGGAAVHDGNFDPLFIAFAQKDKGGPPHVFSMFGASEAFASATQKSSDERVLAARSQGDAQDHHGEQDDDGRGGHSFNEEDSEEELIA